MGKEFKAKKELGTGVRSSGRQKRREVMKRLVPGSLLPHQALASICSFDNSVVRKCQGALKTTWDG